MFFLVREKREEWSIKKKKNRLEGRELERIRRCRKKEGCGVFNQLVLL